MWARHAAARRALDTHTHAAAAAARESAHAPALRLSSATPITLRAAQPGVPASEGQRRSRFGARKHRAAARRPRPVVTRLRPAPRPHPARGRAAAQRGRTGSAPGPRSLPAATALPQHRDEQPPRQGQQPRQLAVEQVEGGFAGRRGGAQSRHNCLGAPPRENQVGNLGRQLRAQPRLLRGRDVAGVGIQRGRVGRESGGGRARETPRARGPRPRPRARPVGSGSGRPTLRTASRQRGGGSREAANAPPPTPRAGARRGAAGAASPAQRRRGGGAAALGCGDGWGRGSRRHAGGHAAAAAAASRAGRRDGRRRPSEAAGFAAARLGPASLVERTKFKKANFLVSEHQKRERPSHVVFRLGRVKPLKRRTEQRASASDFFFI